MLRTDYSGIAERYDNNEIRHDIQKDHLIEKIHSEIRDMRILDLACGTGNYIQKQSEYFKGYSISWFGIDSSPEMPGKQGPKNRMRNSAKEMR